MQRLAGAAFHGEMTSLLLLEWSQKAASNSAQLAAEARLLFDANHSARAYYLAHMSAEESSKSILLHCIHMSGTPVSKSKVDLLLRNHKKKIEFIVSFAVSESQALKSALSNLQSELISHLNDMKNDSMYVSCEDGRAVSPEGRITASDAAAYLGAAEGLLSLANSLLIHHLSETPLNVPLNSNVSHLEI